MTLRIFISLLFFYCLTYSQSITKEELIGSWIVESADLNQKMFSEEEAELVAEIKSVFVNSKIHFAKNNLIKMELNGRLPEPFNHKMFDRVFYYGLNGNYATVGHRKNSSSIMVIKIEKHIKGLILHFLGVELKVIPLESNIRLTFDKETLKSISSILPSKPLMFDFIEENEIRDYKVVERMPVSYDCDESMRNAELRECVADSIVNHVNYNFNTNLAGELGLSGIFKIESEFIIDKDGDIINIEASSPNDLLSQEAIRIINTIPRFQPATENSKPVSIKYKLPIVFQIVD